MMTRTLAIAVLWFIAAVDTAHAYLDPAAGRLQLQVILSGVAGVAVAYRMLRNRIRAWLNGRSETGDSPRSSAPLE